jgi:2-polyprenyl-3-methyl-5-hydroxy-6-metoxy-1,4-benzoquinol methylase
MNQTPSFQARQQWQLVRDRFDGPNWRLGKHWSYNLFVDPKRLGFVLSRYKFSAKMACAGCDVLELGCSEGIGTAILAESARSYTGVDLDTEAIRAATENWNQPAIRFIEDDFLGKVYGQFDSVVSLDVIEHIAIERENEFFETMVRNLADEGIAVIGTPNQTAGVYASVASREGHINLYTADRFRRTIEQFFHTVFLFGMNDEIVHVGFEPMAHYLLAVGCNPKRGDRA